MQALCYVYNMLTTNTGLIKALRASKGGEDAVVQIAVADISKEVKSADWDIKAGAVLKLTYVRRLSLH